MKLGENTTIANAVKKNKIIKISKHLDNLSIVFVTVTKKPCKMQL